MPFIGNQPALSYTSFAKQDFTTSATTSYTLDQPVANENELALFINFVRQEPTTSYTASGTSLTLTSATSATDDMYCVYLGKAVQTVTPASGSITNAMLSSGSFSNITDVGTLASGLTLSDNILFNAASKGIYLGVTTATASNLLDDYEEGTWTPEISGGTTAGTGTYAVQNGRYTKIGNQVTICCYMNITAHTGTGLMRLSNFPFTILNVTNLFHGVSIGLFKNVTLPASSIPYAYAVFNTTLANVQAIPLGGGTTTDVSVDGSCEIAFSLTYTTN